MSSFMDGFLKGYSVTSNTLNNNARAEREQSEYDRAVRQRDITSLQNQYKNISYDERGQRRKPEEILADPRFKELTKHPLIRKQTVNAEGEERSVNSFRKNPANGKYIAKLDMHDSDTGAITREAVMTENGTSNDNDPVLQLTADEAIGQFESLFSELPGYADKKIAQNQLNYKNSLKRSFASGYGDFVAGQQRAAQQPVAQQTQPSVAQIQQPVPRNQTDVKPKLRKADDSVNDKMRRLTVPQYGVEIDDEEKVAAYDDFIRYNADLYSTMGSEKFEVARNSIIEAKQNQLGVEAEKLSKSSTKDAYNHPVVGKRYRELTEEIIKLQKLDPVAKQNVINNPVHDLAKSPAQGKDMKRKMNKVLANKPASMFSAGRKQSNLVNGMSGYRPGSTLPKKLRDQIIELSIIDPESMPQETLHRVLTTGRLTKTDVGHIKMNDNTAVIYDKSIGQMINKITVGGGKSIADIQKEQKSKYQTIIAREKAYKAILEPMAKDHEGKTDYSKFNRLYNQALITKDVFPELSIENEDSRLFYDNAQQVQSAWEREKNDSSVFNPFSWFGEEVKFESFVPGVIALNVGKDMDTVYNEYLLPAQAQLGKNASEDDVMKFALGTEVGLREGLSLRESHAASQLAVHLVNDNKVKTIPEGIAVAKKLIEQNKNQ